MENKRMRETIRGKTARWFWGWRFIFHACVVDVLINSVRFAFWRPHGLLQTDSRGDAARRTNPPKSEKVKHSRGQFKKHACGNVAFVGKTVSETYFKLCL